MTDKRQPWKKVGKPNTLARVHGKFLKSQTYLNPNTGKEEDFAMFGQRDWFVTLVMTTNSEIITVSEFKQGRDKWGMELPAGTFTGDGPPDISLVEENVSQETGYTGKVISLGYT